MGHRAGDTAKDRTFVCPWWLVYSFDNPLRRVFQRPDRVLQGLVSPGDRCLDMGCGMGYFTIPMAQMVGEAGHVTAVDLQAKMLAGVRRRAGRWGLTGRITLATPSDAGWDTEGSYDFALAFWMVHEVPGQDAFFGRLRRLVKQGGRLLVVEPRLHVSGADFDRSVERAIAARFAEVGRPRIAFSRSVLLQ